MASRSRGGQPGNQNRKRFTTAESRRALCAAYCKHLSGGFSPNCFPDADYRTVQSYMEKHPEDFDAEAVRAAERKGRMFWEKMGMDGVRGKVERFSAATWIFTMKNKYGYSDSPNQASDPLEVARQIIEFHEQAKRMESGQ